MNNEKTLLFFKFLLNYCDLQSFNNNSNFKTIREIFTSNDFSLDDFYRDEEVFSYRTTLRDAFKRSRQISIQFFQNQFN